MKENTFKSCLKAFSISGAPYSPGILNRAKFASGIAFRASSQLSTDSISLPESSFLVERSSRNEWTAGKTLSITLSSSLLTTIIKSLGDAASASSVNKLVLFKISLLASVPIII